ncbi:MAG: hypothetical protein ACREDE_05150 [Thermoplasmata archaeon]
MQWFMPRRRKRVSFWTTRKVTKRVRVTFYAKRKRPARRRRR